MKKKGLIGLMLCLTLGAGTGAAVAGSNLNDNAVAIEKTINNRSVDQLMNRLHEIKDLARSGNLSAGQKQDLKKEVLNIKKELKQQDPVLIISLSAALIIALILVLLAR